MRAAEKGAVTLPREILPGRTYLVTRRCVQRQYLLRPDERTKAIFDYCLAEAAARYDIDLIAWCGMANHYHAVVHDRHGRLPSFLEQLHKMVARALNARWERHENLWSTDPTCVTYLPTPEAVFEKVVYVLANPLNDHLIDRLVDWPGSLSLQHLDGQRTTHARPIGFFRASGPMPARVELSAAQPVGSQAIETASQWAARVRAAVETVEREQRERRMRDGGRVFGRKTILALSPFDSPRTEGEHGSVGPTIAGRDRENRNEQLANLKSFLEHYYRALRSFVAGCLDVEFPAGTYRLRRLGVRCAPYGSTAMAA